MNDKGIVSLGYDSLIDYLICLDGLSVVAELTVYRNDEKNKKKVTEIMLNLIVSSEYDSCTYSSKLFLDDFNSKEKKILYNFNTGMRRFYTYISDGDIIREGNVRNIVINRLNRLVTRLSK